MGKDSEEDILKLVTEIVAAYVSKNPVPAIPYGASSNSLSNTNGTAQLGI